jgi:CheY-like chemotaxis protein
MPDGGTLTFLTKLVQVTAGTPEQDLPAGPYLRIAVIDTGIGMDEETRRHLFEPFFTTKQQGKGTGLGLASVYGTVKDHHGAIHISSQPGRGTSVVIHLPLHQMAEVASPAGPSTAAPRESGAGRILLVDDEDSIRDISSEMLRSLGYEVSVSPDGATAVEAYRRDWREIDLVILDLVMPTLGGREAFIAMRAINPGLRALISSGYSMDGQVQELLLLGAADFVHKPFRIADLHKRIRMALGRNPPV